MKRMFFVLTMIALTAIIFGQYEESDTIDSLPEGWEDAMESNFSILSESCDFPYYDLDICDGAVVYDIRIAGNTLYSAQWKGCSADATRKIETYRINNPSGIVSTSHVTMANDTIHGLDIAGNFLYAVSKRHYLYVYRITPTLGSCVYSGAISTQELRHIEIQGDYAFVITRDSLLSVDISNPASPSIADRLNIGGTNKNIMLQGNYAFIPRGGNVTVADIGDPSEMSVIATITAPANSWDVAPDGDVLYIADVYSNGRIMAYNISNPASPASISTFTFSAGDAFEPTGIAIDGDYAVMTGPTSGGTGVLQYVDISDPSSMSADYRDTYASRYIFRSIVHGQHLYMSTRQDHIFSARTKYRRATNPDTYDEVTDTMITYLEIWGDTVICAGKSGISLVDISDPADPDYLGVYRGSGSALVGKYLCGLDTFDKWLYAVGRGYIYWMDISSLTTGGISWGGSIAIGDDELARESGIPIVHRQHLFVSGVENSVWRIWSFDINTSTGALTADDNLLINQDVYWDTSYCGLIRIEGDTAYVGLKRNPYPCATGHTDDDTLIYAIDIHDPSNMALIPHGMAKTGLSGDGGYHVVSFDVDGDSLYADIDTTIGANNSHLVKYSIKDAGGAFPVSGPASHNGTNYTPYWLDIWGNDVWWTRGSRVYNSDAGADPILYKDITATGSVKPDLPHFVVHGENMFLAGYKSYASPYNGYLISMPIYSLCPEYWAKKWLSYGNPSVPEKVAINRVYPNPFNSVIAIEFSISEKGDTKVEVLDISGRVSATILERELDPGEYSIRWNAKDFLESELESGLYFIKLTTEDCTATRSAIFVK